MKKITLSLLLLSVSLLTQAQYRVREKASIFVVDEYQREKGEEAVLEYIHKKELAFINGDWMYLVSYAPLEHDMSSFIRKGFLYRRKISEPGSWERAEYSELFTHYYLPKRIHYMNYDRYRWHCKTSPGTSAVEFVHTKNGKCIAMFMGIQFRYHYGRETFTHIFLFYPHEYRENGSIQYAHRDLALYAPGDFQRFRYTGRDKNAFHDVNKELIIHFDYSYDKNNDKVMPKIWYEEP